MSLVETSKLLIEGKGANTQRTYSSLSKNFNEYLEKENLSLETLQPHFRLSYGFVIVLEFL
jgi:hypothetical protein